MRLLIAFALMVSCGDDSTPMDVGVDVDGRIPDVFIDGPTRCLSDSDCSDGVFCTGQERCDPTRFDADEHGCVAPDEPACPPDRCDEDRRRCLTDCDLFGDMDMDGAFSIECAGGDCDDMDPGRFPGNEELCDGMDQDCDEDVDEGCRL